jgi:type I restriction enzyme S subunit
MEGREPYLAPNLWSLFPERLDADDKPEEWRISKIRELANVVQYGLTQSAKSSGPGPQFLRITDIQGGCVSWPSVPFCNASEKEEDCYRLLSGDIVVARTGASTGENPYVVDPPRAVFASYLVRFQFSDPAVARIVAHYMRSMDYRSFVAGCIGGSAQPNASAQVLGSAPMVFPHVAVADTFLDCVSPLDRAKRHNERENEVLAQTRDLLLPKLMSGEIRPREAEKLVEKVA